MPDTSAPAAAETAPATSQDAQAKAATPASEATETSAPSSNVNRTRMSTRTVQINTRRGQVTFEAKGKGDAAAPSVEKIPASATPATGAASEAPPPKPTEPAPHRALTKAMELEARVVEERRVLKAERESWEASKAQLDADVKAIQQARSLVKEGKRLKALELLGVTLDDVQDEFLASVKEETPEDKAARIVRDTLAKEREAIAQQAREAEEAAAKERTVVEQGRIDWYKGQVEEFYKTRVAEFDPAAFEGVDANQVWQRACAEVNSGRPLPTASEALDLIQKDFDARLAKSKRYRPAEATPPATTVKQDSPRAKDAPRTLTTRGAGSVPVTAKPDKRALTARERAHEAMRELGLK